MIYREHHPQSALDAPRFCVGGAYPSTKRGQPKFYNETVSLEEGIPQAVVDKLKEMGHKVEVVKGRGRILFGKGQVILNTRDERTGQRIYVAGTDPRGDGVALPLL